MMTLRRRKQFLFDRFVVEPISMVMLISQAQHTFGKTFVNTTFKRDDQRNIIDRAYKTDISGILDGKEYYFDIKVPEPKNNKGVKSNISFTVDFKKYMSANRPDNHFVIDFAYYNDDFASKGKIMMYKTVDFIDNLVLQTTGKEYYLLFVKNESPYLELFAGFDNSIYDNLYEMTSFIDGNAKTYKYGFTANEIIRIFPKTYRCIYNVDENMNAFNNYNIIYDDSINEDEFINRLKHIIEDVCSKHGISDSHCKSMLEYMSFFSQIPI